MTLQWSWAPAQWKLFHQIMLSRWCRLHFISDFLFNHYKKFWYWIKPHLVSLRFYFLLPVHSYTYACLFATSIFLFCTNKLDCFFPVQPSCYFGYTCRVNTGTSFVSLWIQKYFNNIDNYYYLVFIIPIIHCVRWYSSVFAWLQRDEHFQNSQLHSEFNLYSGAGLWLHNYVES